MFQYSDIGSFDQMHRWLKKSILGNSIGSYRRDLGFELGTHTIIMSLNDDVHHWAECTILFMITGVCESKKIMNIFHKGVLCTLNYYKALFLQGYSFDKTLSTPMALVRNCFIRDVLFVYRIGFIIL